MTNRDRSGQLEPQVFVMDMQTGKANSFAKVMIFELLSLVLIFFGMSLDISHLAISLAFCIPDHMIIDH